MTDDDIVCVWVEDYPCGSVNEAKARERYWIEKEGELNMKLPNRTFTEYCEANKEDRKIKNKEWREKNKDHLYKYYEENKERFQEKSKRYYENNKEAVKKRAEERREEINKNQRERNKQKTVCSECGVEISKGCIYRHQKRFHTN